MIVKKEYTAEKLAYMINIKRRKQKGDRIDLTLDFKWDDPLSFVVHCTNIQAALQNVSPCVPVSWFLKKFPKQIQSDPRDEGNGKLKVVFTIHAGDETTRPLLLDNAPLVKIVWDKEKVKEEHLDSLYKILEKARPPPAPEIEPPAAIELPAEETKAKAKPRAEEVLDECPNEIISP